jgi:hypothetical protein
VSTFIHLSHFLLFVSWNLEKLTRRNLSLISFIFFFFVTKVSWKSIRHEMFEVDTGLLFSSSFSSLIIPRLCFHMVRGETSNPDRFTSSSRLRWAFQFFVLFPSFSRCATSQPAAQQSALLCFHNNHSILNYHFPPPPFFLFFNLFLLFVLCIRHHSLFQLFFTRVLFSGVGLDINSNITADDSGFHF